MKLTTLNEIASRHFGSVVYALVSERSGGHVSLRVVGDEETLKDRSVQVGIQRHQRHEQGYRSCGTRALQFSGIVQPQSIDLVLLRKGGGEFTVGKHSALVVTPL